MARGQLGKSEAVGKNVDRSERLGLLLLDALSMMMEGSDNTFLSNSGNTDKGMAVGGGGLAVGDGHGGGSGGRELSKTGKTAGRSTCTSVWASHAHKITSGGCGAENDMMRDEGVLGIDPLELPSNSTRWIWTDLTPYFVSTG
uniref:Uncharacterized protein n=1 Tax=Oryza sativa subsp. japonica TaxID=39947 RepID=Q75LQ2_ORYSJ|nr:hypothetical protein [Oryza sativa Japonica Group]